MHRSHTHHCLFNFISATHSSTLTSRTLRIIRLIMIDPAELFFFHASCFLEHYLLSA